MPPGVPKLFIDEFVGISNRLETLPLAFAIRQAYGHDIVLDWHELDSMSVDGTARGKVGVLARLGALRVRECDRARFTRLPVHLRGAHRFEAELMVGRVGATARRPDPVDTRRGAQHRCPRCPEQKMGEGKCAEADRFGMST